MLIILLLPCSETFPMSSRPDKIRAFPVQGFLRLSDRLVSNWLNWSRVMSTRSVAGLSSFQDAKMFRSVPFPCIALLHYSDRLECRAPTIQLVWTDSSIDTWSLHGEEQSSMCRPFQTKLSDIHRFIDTSKTPGWVPPICIPSHIVPNCFHRSPSGKTLTCKDLQSFCSMSITIIWHGFHTLEFTSCLTETIVGLKSI